MLVGALAAQRIAGDTACVTDVLAGEPKFDDWRTDWGS